jgi:sulfur relay (sulfurtransferase) DsrF/TusC family protein
LKFDKNRVTYIRNNEQKKATFNIINAAFNYCKKDSIQLIVDGDDQLIGKQVLKMINAQYQKHDLWVMYTFYKNDRYV